MSESESDPENGDCGVSSQEKHANPAFVSRSASSFVSPNFCTMQFVQISCAQLEFMQRISLLGLSPPHQVHLVSSMGRACGAELAQRRNFARFEAGDATTATEVVDMCWMREEAADMREW